ncbi:hypothetical protein C8Q79DRAFT_905579 [Trametes meyenii]|nr:hypothetical protein C8Q79DRAFT_905579 [Trametes meyenii]
MPASTLLSLRGTCRAADVNVHSEFEHRYSRLLSPFVADQHQFREVLDAANTFISRSTAVAFFSGRNLRPHDLDLYAVKGDSARIISYLIGVKGYKLVRAGSPIGEALYRGGIYVVFRLVCMTDSVLIDVIESNTASSYLPLLHFWCTVPMNILCSKSFTALYPSLLEDCLGLLNPICTGNEEAQEDLDRLTKKYHAYGFDVRPFESSWDILPTGHARCAGRRSLNCPLTVCWVGDRFCLPIEDPSLWPAQFELLTVQTIKPLTVVWWRGGATCGCGILPGPDKLLPSRAWTQPLEHVE